MLDDIFIQEIVKDVKEKYLQEHGKAGIAKEDVIAAVIDKGGNMDDIRKTMMEGAFQIIREIPDIKVLYE